MLSGPRSHLFHACGLQVDLVRRFVEARTCQVESALSKNTAASHRGPASRKASRGSRKLGRQASEVFRRCGLQRAWHTTFPASWALAFSLPGSFAAGTHGKHVWKAVVLSIICQRPPLSEVVLPSSLDS